LRRFFVSNFFFSPYPPPTGALVDPWSYFFFSSSRTLLPSPLFFFAAGILAALLLKLTLVQSQGTCSDLSAFVPFFFARGGEDLFFFFPLNSANPFIDARDDPFSFSCADSRRSSLSPPSAAEQIFFSLFFGPASKSS